LGCLAVCQNHDKRLLILLESSPMDIALKQRLVGASVLIALAVVIFPMLLGGRPDGDAQKSQKIELPPRPPELDFETRRYPVGEQAPGQQQKSKPTAAKPLPSPGSSAGPTVEASNGPVADTVPREPSGQQLEPPGTETAAGPSAGLPPTEKLPPETLPGEAGRYVVQVASFGAIDNANRLSKTLRGYGYSIMLDTIKSDVGTLHRVRVGPYGSESEANSVVDRLQTQVGDIKPRVMDLQPEKAAQVTKPSDPLVRWVVQVGSFSSADNADKLVARLRLESMTAYKEEVSSSGSTIFRVRIGPFLEREEAIRVDKQVLEHMGIDGVVMSSD
jgi:DedD protein